MSEHHPRPRAFRLDDSKVVLDDAPPRAATSVIIESEAAPIPPETRAAPIDATERDIETAQKRGILSHWRVSLASVVWSGIGGLVSLAIGLWFTQLLEGLFARAQALGWVGAAFGALALSGIFAVAAREIFAISRQSRIAKLHVDLAQARASDNRDAARTLVARLVALYEARPGMAAARAQTLEATRAIIDGRDLIDIAERTLLRPLDARAQGEIAAAAKRVSMVTAISPRAILDLLFVIAQIIRLIRRIAEIYGGRPGLLGFFKLARSIGAHIAITGGMAVGDSLLQQVVGHGIASRISARLGEGVLNGLLTARVGLSALAVCRPAPFSVAKPPGVADVAPFLFSSGKDG